MPSLYLHKALHEVHITFNLISSTTANFGLAEVVEEGLIESFLLIRNYTLELDGRDLLLIVVITMGVFFLQAGFDRLVSR